MWHPAFDAAVAHRRIITHGLACGADRYLRLQVRKELSELPVQKIPVAEFAALCRRHGISDAQAMRMLDAFHDSGIVLHFGTASSSKLRETVFIKPRVRTRAHRSNLAPQSPHCCSLIVSLFPP